MAGTSARTAPAATARLKMRVAFGHDEPEGGAERSAHNANGATRWPGQRADCLHDGGAGRAVQERYLFADRTGSFCCEGPGGPAADRSASAIARADGSGPIRRP